ncbi:hypothetical protein PG996_008061 [Apiospora saccharicola]|uniref:Secreted protein n=1 Tax=Apiospora saccharicola TaxID=335842 RepID=A0ABR1V004_9PEZI
MKLTPVITKSLASTAILLIGSNLGVAMAMPTKDRFQDDGAVDPPTVPVDEVVELCPNPDFQAIDDTVPCLNYTDPATPKGYGQRDTCMAMNIVRVTNDCEPDIPSNAHIIASAGESRLDEDIDDKTVAFRCRWPEVSPTHKYGHPTNAFHA